MHKDRISFFLYIVNVIFIVLWTTIFALLGFYLTRNPKLQSWLKLLWRAKALRKWFICTASLFLLILSVYLFYPTAEETPVDPGEIFRRYSAETVYKLDSIQKIQIDSSCLLDNVHSELSYVLPLVINSYNEIVTKPTMPVLIRLDDTLQIEMRGYKQFKNRSILLSKLLRKKLGNRYDISITSVDATHTLQIVYNGTAWDIEQLCALPVMEASHKFKIDPALLMSLIHHVSDFNFNYKGSKDTGGILALENGEGLEQIFLGAERLSKMLQVGISRENAVATFYPDFGIGEKSEDWYQKPLARSWVSLVLEDVQFYRENGLR